MSSVGISTSGPHETVLPPESRSVTDAIDAAETLTGAPRHEALSAIVADNPRSVVAWARLATAGRDPVETYAAFRIGYHRGLDLLRANGWRRHRVRALATRVQPPLPHRPRRAGAVCSGDRRGRRGGAVRALSPSVGSGLAARNLLRPPGIEPVWSRHERRDHTDHRTKRRSAPLGDLAISDRVISTGGAAARSASSTTPTTRCSTTCSTRSARCSSTRTPSTRSATRPC